MATAEDMAELARRLQTLETGLNERCQRLEALVETQQNEIQRRVVQVARQSEDSRTLVEQLQARSRSRVGPWRSSGVRSRPFALRGIPR